MGPNVFIRAAHSSGKWDGPDDAFKAEVTRLRKNHSLVTRTEETKPIPEEATWRVWHPEGADCSIEWDAEVWKVVDLGQLQLTSIRIHTEKGFLKPPCSATLATLEHRESGLRVHWSTAHLDLENTPLRRQAAQQERIGLSNHWSRAMHRMPDIHQVFQGDINLDQRSRADRELTGQLIPHGMVNLWAGALPAEGGTHGQAVLDVALSTLPGRVQLLADDSSSDHRPFEADYHARVLTGAVG
jgi:hypothetical protein